MFTKKNEKQTDPQESTSERHSCNIGKTLEKNKSLHERNKFRKGTRFVQTLKILACSRYRSLNLFASQFAIFSLSYGFLSIKLIHSCFVCCDLGTLRASWNYFFPSTVTRDRATLALNRSREKRASSWCDFLRAKEAIVLNFEAINQVVWFKFTTHF